MYGKKRRSLRVYPRCDMQGCLPTQNADSCVGCFFFLFAALRAFFVVFFLLRTDYSYTVTSVTCANIMLAAGDLLPISWLVTRS